MLLPFLDDAFVVLCLVGIAEGMVQLFVITDDDHRIVLH